ncbi:MAG: hypothetical protein PQJ44_02860 [Sphaerochaetaceae bacterium]|nr:hypothetical protein [Sphaerochaetaceae bacterium]
MLYLLHCRTYYIDLKEAVKIFNEIYTFSYIIGLSSDKCEDFNIFSVFSIVETFGDFFL